MNKIELTREELTTILQVATGNVKDFVMDSDNFIDEQLKAINYIPCCTELKEKEAMTFEGYLVYSRIIKKNDKYYLKGKEVSEFAIRFMYNEFIK